MNILIICLGVMYGVAGANTALRAIAKGLANGISKKIMSTALTRGITFITFNPCCDKLKESLQDTLLSNPNHTEEKDSKD